MRTTLGDAAATTRSFSRSICSSSGISPDEIEVARLSA